MSLREFLILMAVCTAWGLHFTVLRVTVSDVGVPPLFYAAMRMSLVALVMLPWLRWHPGQMGYVLLAGLGFGALNYALIFPALGMTTASAASVAIELYMPMSVLLGVVLLGERIRAWSTFGIVLAFAGVVIIGLAGHDGEAAGPLFALGLVMIAGAAFSEAVGAVAVKRLSGVSPPQIVAWSGVVGSLVIWPLTLGLETNQTAAFAPEVRWNFLAALAYSALLVSVVTNACYYWLLGRLPISTVAPIGLMTTVIGVLGGVLILGEDPTLGLMGGMAVTLAGVGIILWRTRVKADAEISRGRPIAVTSSGHLGPHEHTDSHTPPQPPLL